MSEEPFIKRCRRIISDLAIYDLRLSQRADILSEVTVRLLRALRFIACVSLLVILNPAASAQERRSGRDALETLKTELHEAGPVWLSKYREATTDRERAELQRIDPYRVFEPRFLALARTYADETTAIEAVHWLAENAASGPVLDEGLALIEHHQLEDPGVAKLCRPLMFKLSPGVERFLLAVAAKHPDRKTQGLAYLCVAQYLKNLSKVAKTAQSNEQWLKAAKKVYSDDTIAWIRAADSAHLSARVDKICERLINEYSAVRDEAFHETTGRNRSLADAAKVLSFSLHAVGSPAPESSGRGVHGSQINLTDLRGNVVVLMFSADWCGPCKAMYGQLRELMRLYADKRFSVMTVMADKDVTTVAKAVESGEITWPAIWDGQDGPIASRWGITGYPSIYLIDRDGRITSQDLRDDALDDEVARMLGISPESRVRVDKRTRVWTLSLRGKKLTEAELAKLLEGYTELRDLDLSDNAIQDEALLHLLPLKKLETVHLEHTGISDRGLQILEGLPKLKTVHLDVAPGHRTTEAGLRQLRKAIPGLQILFITH